MTCLLPANPKTNCVQTTLPPYSVSAPFAYCFTMSPSVAAFQYFIRSANSPRRYALAFSSATGTP